LAIVDLRAGAKSTIGNLNPQSPINKIRDQH